MMVCLINFVVMSNKNIILDRILKPRSRRSCKGYVFCTPQPIESLRFSKTSDGALLINSDTKLLLNSQRIRDTLGEDVYLNIVRSIQPSRPNALRDKLTDDQLLTLVKSRFLQSPSEMRAWMASLEREYSDLVDTVKEANSKLAAEQVEQVDQSSSSKTE